MRVRVHVMVNFLLRTFYCLWLYSPANKNARGVSMFGLAENLKLIGNHWKLYEERSN